MSKHNFFLFDHYYLQITRASMGAKFSLSLVNIYMSWWENKGLFSSSNIFSSAVCWFSGYIDDFFFFER